MAVEAEIAEVLLADRDVCMLFWNEATGWTQKGNSDLALDVECLGMDGIFALNSLVSDKDRELCGCFLEKLQAGMGTADEFIPVQENQIKTALHLQRTDCSWGYFSIVCYFLKGAEGVIRKMVVQIQELDAEEKYRLQLAQTITNDKNPAYFMHGANEIMERHPDWKYALIQFDVAKFKLINEQYGEAMGDELLNYFIHTLELLCNEEQLYVRLSADVFMIITSYETEEDILQFIQLLEQKLSGYKGIIYTLVFGVCYVGDMSQGIRKYGDGAAFARQSIKGNALQHVAFYREDMREHARIRKFVEDNMEAALANGEFVMYLQPKYSISQNRMVGAEALARWIHPEKGMISPMNFIPLFEKNGFVIKLDQYIWEEACKTIRKWLDQGMEPLPISVNVSRRHLSDGEFVQVLNRLIEKYQIPKKYLEIEITETVEEEGVDQGVALLKQNGYVLLMDDFGSGYSSLNMLRDTQFDVIKIDRGFLQDFIGSDRGQKIVEHTIKMAREIGLDLIAEGVETKEQAVFLSDCGCDTAQGFYYAKPMDLKEFDETRGLK